MYVDKKNRKKGIAKLLIDELIKYGESNYFSTIRAKVATELASNIFWEGSHFLIIKQELGGTIKSKNRRQINYRSFALDTPDLFKETFNSTDISISYPEKPQFSLPIFTIDLNVLYDITRERDNSEKAKQIFEYGLTGAFRLCLTPEFQEELLRIQFNCNNDPIYEIAKAFPTLNSIDEELLNPLREEIRSIIFPERSLNNRTAQNDQSDLTHLAYCAKNKVGFITSERAILRQAIKLKEKYGITVVSPAEIDFGVTADESITVETDNESLEIKSKNASNEIKLEQFLKIIGLSNTLIDSINSRTQALTNIKEKVAVINENIIGYCGWNTPNSLSTQIDCYLYVNESYNQAVKVIDHFIESILRDTCSHKITRLDLHIEEKQSLTKSTAKKKGFLSTNNKNILTKVAFNGFITDESWKDFIDEFSQITNRIYPTKLPKYKDLVNTGICIEEKTKIHSNCISLFKFESIISPGVILHNERNCLLIPIKESYANDLLGCENRQLSWIPSKSNSLLLEKAYFKSIRMSSYFKKGGLIAFYVSGKKSRQEIIGTARITYTDILKIEHVNLAIHRQGVLSKKDLQKLINKQGKLHTFTFDNFKEFPNKISFKKAREIGLISGANLVTVEELSFQQLNLLLKTAYNL